MQSEKLQKVLAHAGVASRRASEKLIAQGSVTVNGEVITQMGFRVNLEVDDIKVDGVPIKIPAKRTYIILNKPIGVITSVTDPQGRPTVIDLVDCNKRIYPVGRLDFNTSGLLLLTDDGELAHKLTHPSQGVWKKYLVTINGSITNQQIDLLASGVKLEDGITSPAKVNLMYSTSSKSKIEISIHEGRNHQVRRMFDVLGKSITELKRIEFGPLKLSDIDVGKWRYLTSSEVTSLKKT